MLDIIISTNYFNSNVFGALFQFNYIYKYCTTASQTTTSSQQFSSSTNYLYSMNLVKRCTTVSQAPFIGDPHPNNKPILTPPFLPQTPHIINLCISTERFGSVIIITKDVSNFDYLNLVILFICINNKKQKMGVAREGGGRERQKGGTGAEVFVTHTKHLQ